MQSDCDLCAAAHVCVLQVARQLLAVPLKCKSQHQVSAACVQVVAYTHRTLSAALSEVQGSAAAAQVLAELRGSQQV
jgi:hypothetical protein